MCPSFPISQRHGFRWPDSMPSDHLHRVKIGARISFSGLAGRHDIRRHRSSTASVRMSSDWPRVLLHDAITTRTFGISSVYSLYSLQFRKAAHARRGEGFGAYRRVGARPAGGAGTSGKLRAALLCSGSGARGAEPESAGLLLGDPICSAVVDGPVVDSLGRVGPAKRTAAE